MTGYRPRLVKLHHFFVVYNTSSGKIGQAKRCMEQRISARFFDYEISARTVL
jgi:hypothetical protein